LRVPAEFLFGGCHRFSGSFRKKEEGRRKKEEARRKKEEDF
jgi:uncharacterized ParB-like nuclease family protein